MIRLMAVANVFGVWMVCYAQRHTYWQGMHNFEGWLISGSSDRCRRIKSMVFDCVFCVNAELNNSTSSHGVFFILWGFCFFFLIKKQTNLIQFINHCHDIVLTGYICNYDIDKMIMS